MSERTALIDLRSTPWFQSFVKDTLLKDIPQAREYDPSDPHSVEQWKADCMRRQGYILCLQKFGIKLEHINSGDKS